MIKNYIYLNDMNFLNELNNLHVITYFVKITVLDWYERPISEIQGKVISANFNLDGQSSVRRTGNLSMIADKTNTLMNMDSLISMNKKVFIEIGYKNTTNRYTDYPIIWFPLGVYVITSSSISHTLSDLTISLRLEDKMCLLNGECGGTFPASVVFDQYNTIDETGAQVILRPTIYQIIQQLVHHFGNEQTGKIMISDLDTRVKQVMKWTGDRPLYFVEKSGNQYQITIDPEQYQDLLDDGWVDVLGSPFSYGQDVGYIYTDFTYPGELIGDAGGTITDILDQIVSVLGNYEYFYDVYGNFVFQQIKNYLNNSQSKYILDNLNNRILVPDYIADLRLHGAPLPEDYILDMRSGKSTYDLKDSVLIDSYTNNPQYGQIKNDFIVWGIRTLSSNMKLPIRYHLAIDKKPEVGNIYKVIGYQDIDKLTKYTVPLSFSSYADFPTEGQFGFFYLDNNNNECYKWGKDTNGNITYIEVQVNLYTVQTQDWRTQLYFQGIAAQPYGTESNYYYTELANEWPKLYELIQDTESGYYIDKLKDSVLKNPEDVDYFLDIIDVESKISQFQVDNIGRRTQVLNEDQAVNCVFEPQVPDVILLPLSNDQDIRKLRDQAVARDQHWYQVENSIYSYLQIGGNFNSAYQTIRQLLHQYTSYNENISISCLPLYYLEPNVRIGLKDTESSIDGDYIINSISFSLDNSGTMSINLTKAIQKI